MTTESASAAGLTPRCPACGAGALRPARSRSDLQRWLREVTVLERYACDRCGERGWRFGKLPDRRRAPDTGPLPLGRPRTGRARPPRGASRLEVLRPVVVALALGAATAWLLLRMAAGPR